MRTPILLLWICGTILAQAPPQLPPPQLTPKLLEPGSSATVTLSGSETASLTVATEPGNYLRIAANSTDTSTEVTLRDSRKNKLAVATSLGGTGGIAEVAGIAEDRAMTIELRLPRRDAEKREIQVSILALRNADEKDRTDAAGFRAFARALDVKSKAEVFDEAYQLASTAGDPWLQSAITVSRCLAYLGAGEFVKAVTTGQEALNANHPKRAEGVLIYLTAVAHLQHEESRAAIRLFERAVAIERETGQRYEVAYSLHNLGVARWLLGDCRNALDEAREALAIRREMRDRPREAYSLMAVAKDYFCLGDAQHALDVYAEVAPLWVELKDEANQAAVLNDRGLLYSYLGESEKAETVHREALAIRTRIKDKSGLVESLVNLGLQQIAMHQYRAAQPLCEQAVALARELQYRRGEAYALLNLAEALSETGEPAKARSMLLDAIRVFEAEGHRPGEAWARQLLGKLNRLSGDFAAARSDLEKALSLEQEVGDRILMSITLVDLAQVSRALHENTQALKYADQAISLIEQSRASLLAPDMRAAWLASKRDVYGLRISLLREGAGDSAKPASAADALATSEQAHSRVLLDALGEDHGQVRNGLDPEMRAALDQSDTEVNARAASLSRGAASELTELRRALERSIEKKQELEARIRAANPRYASLVLPSPASTEEIRRYALDENTVLLEYFVGDERSYVWALTTNTLDLFELAGRATLEQGMRTLYTALTERNRRATNETVTLRAARLQRSDADVARASKALSQLLLGPVRQQLGRRRMIVVPDGPLYMVPFSLLFPADIHPEIVYLPSASVLVEMRRERPESFSETMPALIIADPVFGTDDERVMTTPGRSAAGSGPLLARLEWSRKEAQSIALLAPPSQVKMLLDFSADSSALRHDDLSRYRVIHIASHALLDTEHPALSSVVFSTVDRRGNARDGQVRLHEIYNLSLQARLVVLSACRTALGKELSGEGMIGLTRGFLYAGAQSVLSTLWSVDDYATSQFMTQFYRELWKQKRSPAEALQAAQQWMMRQSRFRSPYFWAGYALTGEWR